jgi:RNA polymerase sigma-70 factor (ECF subfamily)
MTDEVLLQGCLKNDAYAQQELYYKYSPKMLSVCYRYAKSREDAEDMLQEGFIKVFTQMDKYENRGSLEGWILRIIVHTCINHLKKNKKFNEHVDLAYAGDLMIKEDNIPAILQAKQVVEGYSHKEIGFMLEIEESTSRSQYTRAKNMLEDILVKKNILQPKKEKTKWLSSVKAQ